MNRRLQKWKSVTDDRSPERGVVPGELLIVVSSQSLVASQLEQDLGGGRAEKRPSVPMSVYLERSDLATRRDPQFESLPAQSSICSFIVDSRPHSTIYEHAADFGIEFQSDDRSEVVTFSNAPVGA